MLQGDAMQVAFVFELKRRGVTVEFRQDRPGAVALGSVVVAVEDDKPGRRHGDESISDTIHAEKPRGRDVFIEIGRTCFGHLGLAHIPYLSCTRQKGCPAGSR